VNRFQSAVLVEQQADVEVGCGVDVPHDALWRDAGSLLAVDHMYFEALKWSLGMTEANVTPRA